MNWSINCVVTGLYEHSCITIRSIIICRQVKSRNSSTTNCVSVHFTDFVLRIQTHLTIEDEVIVFGKTRWIFSMLSVLFMVLCNSLFYVRIHSMWICRKKCRYGRTRFFFGAPLSERFYVMRLVCIQYKWPECAVPESFTVVLDMCEIAGHSRA